MKDVPEGFYTVTQTARILKMNNNTVSRYIADGVIEVVEFNIGRRDYYRLITQEALDAFRNRRDLEKDHLYEIVCIVCGEISVLFATHDLFVLRLKYHHMIEHEHKYIRIRLGGEILPIFESDRIGNSSYSITIKEVAANGKKVERGKGAAAGDLSRHDKSGVQHGEESGVLRRGADPQSKGDHRLDRASQGEPAESVQNVAQGNERDVRRGQKEAGRQELPGVSVRPRSGRPEKYASEEERRVTENERLRHWRHEHPEKYRENNRAYYAAHRQEISDRKKKRREADREAALARERAYREAHREEIRVYYREYRKKRKEVQE